MTDTYKSQPLAPISTEGLEDIAETLLVPVKNSGGNLGQTPIFGHRKNKFKNLTIAKKGKIYEVRGEFEGGIIYAVDLIEDSLSAKTQDAHAKQTEEARKAGDFGVLSLPDYQTLFDALNCLKNTKEAESARKLIQTAFRNSYPLTLTRIKYQPSGKKETIVHNYGLQDLVELQEDFVGADGEIKAINCQKELSALTGEDNVQRIYEVYNWINETNVYLFRLNSKPKKIDERVAGFGAGSGGAYLGCGRDPSYSDTALGVRFASPIGRAGRNLQI